MNNILKFCLKYGNIYQVKLIIDRKYKILKFNIGLTLIKSIIIIINFNILLN